MSTIITLGSVMRRVFESIVAPTQDVDIPVIGTWHIITPIGSSMGESVKKKVERELLQVVATTYVPRQTRDKQQQSTMEIIWMT